MTGANITTRRNAIDDRPDRDRRTPDKELRYYKCPVCGTEMSTEARARKHCGKLPGEK